MMEKPKVIDLADVGDGRLRCIDEDPWEEHTHRVALGAMEEAVVPPAEPEEEDGEELP